MFSAKNQETPDNQLIHYHYYNTKLYKNQYEKTIKNGGYIKIPFINARSTTNPNLIYNPTQTKYATKTIYIMPKNHMFPGNHDGELIIEHAPITNSDTPVYSCILLKTKEGIAEETVVDKIINQSFDPYLEVRLDDFVQFNKVCMVNNFHNVFLFPSPILISSRLDNMSLPKDTLFSNYDKTQYTTVDLHATDAPIMEGLAIMDCVPVDMNDKRTETIEMTTVKGKENIYLMTLINFLIFTIMTIGGWYGVPALYKEFIKPFIKNDATPSTANISNIIGLTIPLMILCLILPIMLLIFGVIIRSSMISGLGGYLFVVIIISNFLIYINNKSTIFGTDMNWLDSIKQIYWSLFFKFDASTYIPLFIAFIFLIIIITLYTTKSLDKNKKKINKNSIYYFL